MVRSTGDGGVKNTEGIATRELEGGGRNKGK